MEVETLPTSCRGGRLCAAVSDKGALRMRHTPCGCCPPAAPEARFFRVRRTREAFQPLFLCAAKKKPLAVKRKRQRGGCVGTNFTSLASARGVKSRPFRCSSFSRTNRFAGFARELPLWNPLKTTKKRADAPFLDHSRSLVCAKVNYKSTKRDADANLDRPAR